MIGPDLLWAFIQLYIDDCLAATKTRRAHLFVFESLLKRFDEHDIRLARDKCEFMVSELKWLGYILSGEGIAPDPEKLNCINKIPVPTSKASLSKFLNMSQWHLSEFSPKFSKLAADLWPMTSSKESVRFDWSSEHGRSFEGIKKLCCEKLMRTHFRDDVPSQIVVDASGGALTAILVQDGRMVYCVSRTLNAKERERPAIVLEAMAIRFACKKFRVYILGRRTPVYTDHKPLVGIFKKGEHDNTWIRDCLVNTSEFDLDIRYVEGLYNIADYWTRVNLDPSTDRPDSSVAVINWDVKGWSQFYADSDIREMSELKSRDSAMGKEVLVRGKWKLFVPILKRRALCWSVHAEKHLGVVRLNEMLESYHWPQKLESIQLFVDGCSCALGKERRRPRVPLSQLKSISADGPLELVAIDCFNYNNMDHLTVMDIYSSMLFVYELPDGHSRTEVSRAYDSWESLFGAPGRLLCDRGEEMNLVLENRLFSRTSALHPEGNSKLERAHLTLGDLCRVHDVMPVKGVEFYRTDEMRKLFYGRDIALAKDINYGPDMDLKRSFKVGDLVSRFIQRRSRGKHEDVWTTPRRVIAKVGDRNYIVTDARGKGRATVHVNDLKRVVMSSGLDWTLNKALLCKFLTEWQLEAEDLLLFNSFGEALSASWAGKKILVPINLRECDAVLKKFTADEPELVLWVVPHLPGELWFQKLEALPALWCKLPGKSGDLVDSFYDPIGTFCFDLWFVLLG